MKKLLVGLFLMMTGLAWGQQSETRALSSFRSVKVSQAIDVYLKKGDKESARVEATGIDLSDVATDVEGSSLRIRLKDNRSWRNKVNVKVYVTYVTIEKILVSSAASVFSDGPIKSSRLDIATSSAGSVEVSVEANEVSVDTSSAGEVVIEGKATHLQIEASSAGSVDAYSLESETVNAEVSSAGSAKISVSKELEASASSGGSIRYRGNPTRTNTHSSSGGSVKKSS
jgi:hypothetical protein